MRAVMATRYLAAVAFTLAIVTVVLLWAHRTMNRAERHPHPWRRRDIAPTASPRYLARHPHLAAGLYDTDPNEQEDAA